MTIILMIEVLYGATSRELAVSEARFTLPETSPVPEPSSSSGSGFVACPLVPAGAILVEVLQVYQRAFDEARAVVAPVRRELRTPSWN